MLTVSPRSNRLRVDRLMPAEEASSSYVLFCSMRLCLTNVPIYCVKALSFIEAHSLNEMSVIKYQIRS